MHDSMIVLGAVVLSVWVLMYTIETLNSPDAGSPFNMSLLKSLEADSRSRQREVFFVLNLPEYG